MVLKRHQLPLVPQLGCGLLEKPEFPLSSSHAKTYECLNTGQGEPNPEQRGWETCKQAGKHSGTGLVSAGWAQLTLAKYFGKFVLRVSLYSSAVASHGCRAFDPVLTALGSDLLDSPKIPYDSHKHKITCFFCLAPSWAGVAVTTFHPARCIGLLGSSCFHVVTKSCYVCCGLSKIKKIIHSS